MAEWEKPGALTELADLGTTGVEVIDPWAGA